LIISRFDGIIFLKNSIKSILFISIIKKYIDEIVFIRLFSYPLLLFNMNLENISRIHGKYLVSKKEKSCSPCSEKNSLVPNGNPKATIYTKTALYKGSGDWYECSFISGNSAPYAEKELE
jgi:hypothetical protein